jgi:hypothetical protein
LSLLGTDFPSKPSESIPPDHSEDFLDNTESSITRNPEEHAAKMAAVLDRAAERGLKHMSDKEIKYTIAGHTFNLSDRIGQFSKLVKISMFI